MSFNVGKPPVEHSTDIHTEQYLSWRRLHLSKSKLSNVAEMASFMAGFAVVATVELQINDADCNPILLTAFVVTTSFLVATTMIAICIATCILPHLEGVAKMAMVDNADLSPHDTMSRMIDISWILASTASLFFFTLDVILMCWIKFTYFSRAASIAATAIMTPVLLIILLFGLLFYRKVLKHKYVITNMQYKELEKLERIIQVESQKEINTGRSTNGKTMDSFDYHNEAFSDFSLSPLESEGSSKAHSISEYGDHTGEDGDSSFSTDQGEERKSPVFYLGNIEEKNERKHAGDLK